LKDRNSFILAIFNGVAADQNIYTEIKYLKLNELQYANKNF